MMKILIFFAGWLVAGTLVALAFGAFCKAGRGHSHGRYACGRNSER